MKNKKLIHIASALCFLAYNIVFMSFTASAQINKKTEPVVLNGIVTFTGITDAAEEKVTYLVKPQNAPDEDFLAIGELSAASDGSFTIEFGLNASGTYVLDIKDANGNTHSETIAYTTAADRQAQLLADINTGTADEVKSALWELNFEYDEVKFNSLTEEAKNWIVKYLPKCGPYTLMADAQSEYKKQNALYAINSAKVAGIKAEVAKHQAFLALAANSEVNTFVTYSGTAQQTALVTSLSSNPAYTTDLLVSAITAANDVPNPTPSYPSSGGGGGGGGGGASKPTITGISINPNPAPSQEPKEETKTFADMSEAAWAKEAVESLCEKGVISGDENGNFRPNSGITREEFVKMVVVAFGVKDAENNFVFLDVFDSDWYFEYVGAAYEAGIVNGISEDFFGINKPLTRQDAAVILKRAADYAQISINDVREYDGFNDSNEIADYAADAVNTLYRGGVISGMPDGSFKPTDTCTRAETAKMIYEII